MFCRRYCFTFFARLRAWFSRNSQALVATTLLIIAPSLHAGNPTNPILFVTQTPMPEEVNTRDVTQSFMSSVSPFSNHLADTLHAGRGGSLWVRFANGQMVNLLSVALQSATLRKFTICPFAKRTHNDPPLPACKVSAR